MKFRALLALACVVGALAGMPPLSAEAQTAAALSGQVSSAEEGAMEGVLVSAKKHGSTITVTVVTDAKGRLQLPGGSARRRPLCRSRIRAAGYDLDRPKAVDIAAGGSMADIKLVKTKNLANQLSNARMADQRAGSRQPQGQHDQLRGLPHAAARLRLGP